MDYFGSEVTRLIEKLSLLPGIGQKTAQRLAFHIIHMPEDQVEEISSAMVSARKNVRYCACCCT